MSDLGPLDFARMAALTMSGFHSSKDALDAVAEHVDTLCADIVESLSGKSYCTTYAA